MIHNVKRFWESIRLDDVVRCLKQESASFSFSNVLKINSGDVAAHWLFVAYLTVVYTMLCFCIRWLIGILLLQTFANSEALHEPCPPFDYTLLALDAFFLLCVLR